MQYVVVAVGVGYRLFLVVYVFVVVWLIVG